MKSYNHLFEKFLTKENILSSIYEAAEHKKHKHVIKEALENIDDFYDEMIQYLHDFSPVNHTTKEIYDGISRKKRKIVVPSFKEQVVHHMIMNVLKPIFSKSMYTHSYASLPDKGGVKGLKAIKKFIAKNKGNNLYVYKADILRFFESIVIVLLKEMLASVIHDARFLRYVNAVLDSGIKGEGLPLGFYTSQWFANYILTPFDHFIKEGLGIAFYIRYMDDIVLVDTDKDKLRNAHERISSFLNERLRLKLKDNWQIFPLKSPDNNGRFIDFMGYRIYSDRVTLRRKLYYKITRKARRLSKKKPTIHDSRQMMSYFGWLKHSDTHASNAERVFPFVSKSELTKIISRYDRRKSNVAKS